jgi:hypothetical protein
MCQIVGFNHTVGEKKLGIGTGKAFVHIMLCQYLSFLSAVTVYITSEVKAHEVQNPWS